MLADPRATDALVDDFAAQWLNLRRVDEVVVHPDFYPDFDDNLLEAFKQETALSSRARCRKIAASLDLLRADYTFVNERLARHYGIPGSTAAASGASRFPTPSNAADCWRTARCWPRRRIRIAHRPCCAASGCSTTSSACMCRRRRRMSTRA